MVSQPEFLDRRGVFRAIGVFGFGVDDGGEVVVAHLDKTIGRAVLADDFAIGEGRPSANAFDRHVGDEHGLF